MKLEDIYNNAFYDDHKDASLLSAKSIVPLILRMFKINAVLDVGCGTGAWLSVFAQNGVKEIRGFDANELPQETYFIDTTKITTKCDFSSANFNLNTHADMTISLEVAEHLPEVAADNFVRLLVSSAPIIIFSAAFPGQTGVNHINEQPPWYWRDKFNRLGYFELDFLRPQIWKQEHISWWYRQNITCFLNINYLRANPRLSDLARIYGQTQEPHRLTLVDELILKKEFEKNDELSQYYAQKLSHNSEENRLLKSTILTSIDVIKRASIPTDAAREIGNSLLDTGYLEEANHFFQRTFKVTALDKTQRKTKPFLTVAIPTFNRSKLLEQTLDTLTVQTYPSNQFEVLVIDNGSTDKTAETCLLFKDRIENFKYIYDERPGLHVGRHDACKLGEGDILTFADDDIKAFPTWLEGVAESFQDPSIALVGGKILPDFEVNPPQWVHRLWWRTPWGQALGWYSLLDFGDGVLEISPDYVWGCNFSIRKKILLEVGGFHPDSVPQKLIRFRGDGETAVSIALKEKGYKALYNPKASVYHFVSKDRMTLDYLYRRAFAQGISDSYTQIRATKQATGFKQFTPVNDDVQNTINKGQTDGFNFHQNAVKQSPELLSWVLKIDYFDYKLPEV